MQRSDELAVYDDGSDEFQKGARHDGTYALPPLSRHRSGGPHLLRGPFQFPVQLHTFQEFNRTDGPADAIAHGYLGDGPVRLFAADVVGDEAPLRCEGMMLSLLGAAAPKTLRDWFSRLSAGGRVVDDLQARP